MMLSFEKICSKMFKVHHAALFENCEMRSCPVHLGTTLLAPEGSTNRCGDGVGEVEFGEPYKIYKPITSFYFLGLVEKESPN